MELDLHIHSTASDGTVPPAEVVRRALEAGLDVIALTDHDTTAGVAEAMEAVGNAPLEVIPAIEASTTIDGEELHILGYFIDPSDPDILEHRHRAGLRRKNRILEMISRLEAQGVEVAFENVVKAAQGDASNLGRPHLAKALLAAGHVSGVSEAFDEYIGNDHPAYVPTDLGSPARAIEMIEHAGGISVWAHPPEHRIDTLLPGLLSAGLRGLEVYRPRNPVDRVLRLEGIARRAGLLVSGGSDWHGPEGGELGEFRVRGEEIAGLLEEGGL